MCPTAKYMALKCIMCALCTHILYIIHIFLRIYSNHWIIHNFYVFGLENTACPLYFLCDLFSKQNKKTSSKYFWNVIVVRFNIFIYLIFWFHVILWRQKIKSISVVNGQITWILVINSRIIFYLFVILSQM